MALFGESVQTQAQRDVEATELVRKLSAWLDVDPNRMTTFDARSSIFLTGRIARLRQFGNLKFTTPNVLRWLETLWRKTTIP